MRYIFSAIYNERIFDLYHINLTVFIAFHVNCDEYQSNTFIHNKDTITFDILKESNGLAFLEKTSDVPVIKHRKFIDIIKQKDFYCHTFSGDMIYHFYKHIMLKQLIYDISI